MLADHTSNRSVSLLCLKINRYMVLKVKRNGGFAQPLADHWQGKPGVEGA